MIHFYDDKGDHLVESSMGFNGNDLDFEYDLLGTLIQDSGQYSVLFYCNTTDIGGYLEYPVYVNGAGEELTQGKAIGYGFGLVILLMLIAGLLHCYPNHLQS